MLPKLRSLKAGVRRGFSAWVLDKCSMVQRSSGRRGFAPVKDHSIYKKWCNAESYANRWNVRNVLHVKPANFPVSASLPFSRHSGPTDSSRRGRLPGAHAGDFGAGGLPPL